MSTENSDDRKMFIKELIREIHNQLLESKNEREREGELPIFEVDQLVIEANFVIADAKKFSAGFDFKVLKAGTEIHYDSQQVHKITLTLKASSSAGGVDNRFQPRVNDDF